MRLYLEKAPTVDKLNQTTMAWHTGTKFELDAPISPPKIRQNYLAHSVENTVNLSGSGERQSKGLYAYLRSDINQNKSFKTQLLNPQLPAQFFQRNLPNSINSRATKTYDLSSHLCKTSPTDEPVESTNNTNTIMTAKFSLPYNLKIQQNAPSKLTNKWLQD